MALDLTKFLQSEAFKKVVGNPDLANYVIHSLRNNVPFFYPNYTQREVMPNRYARVMRADLVSPAGVVVEYGSNAREQKRGSIETLTIEKFPIKSKRVLTEAEIVDLQALQGNSLEETIINKMVDDVANVMRSINERIEFYFLQALSNYGKIELNSDTNPDGLIKTVDFGVPTDHIITAGTSWSDHINAKPITDIKNIVKIANANGHYPELMFMSPNEFNNLTASNEFKELAFKQIGLSARADLVGVNQVNEIFVGAGLPKIVLIQDAVPIQTATGDIVYGKSWIDGVVVFGYRFMGRITIATPPTAILNQGSQKVFATRNGVLYSREAKTDPIAIETIGTTYGFFAFDKANVCYWLKVD